ncbi:helix-turn-helix domain-containing protein [Cohnella boryungensis]|uniref:Helix-turn-helix domain-containing protein n=1 Tax=Cohnella boryungensis TaxID=768479 RepID=A0ABV8S7D7_9BACL
MSVDNQMALWNEAALRVLDIRRSALQPGNSLRAFRLPSSAFLLANRGRARMVLDGVEHAVEGCYVCHAGKGASLDIVEVAEEFNYDIVYYKASLAFPCRQELLRLYREDNPFRSQFGYAPIYPLSLLTRLELMRRHWQADAQLDKFQVRALFHQWVHEILKQRYEYVDHSGRVLGPLSQIIRYMEEQYAERVSLDDLSSLFGFSSRQLQRLFKSELRMGPMEYMNKIRMEQAQAMLTKTEVSLKEISEAVGYADSYYFSRAFKKHYGISPQHYRSEGRISPSRSSRISIGEGRVRSYSIADDDNHYQYKDEGAIPMNRRTKSMLAVSLMLSLMLFLAACAGNNGGTANGNGANASPSAPASTQPASSAAAETAQQSSYPVTIKHMKGEWKLEQRPERIAVLDTQFVDQLLTLDEQPAGSVTAAGDSSDFPEYLTDKLSDVKVLGTKDEPNLEAIIAMNPDFIICTEFQEKIYDSLTKIAPTVMLNRNDDWRDTLVTFGQIVDKKSEAEQVLAAYKEKTERLKAELATKLAGESVALIRPRDDMIRVHTPLHRTAAILYEDLGLTAPEQVREVQDTAYPISLEALGDVGADHYFLLTDDMFSGLVEEFKSTQTWKSLEPVKQNRVYTVDTTLWIAYYGPIAINKVVDQIGEALLGHS